MPASISKLSSSDRISIEVRDRIEKVTPGCFSRNGVGQARHHGQRGRDRGDADMAGKPVPRRAHLLVHGAGIADDAARPFQHPLAFRRQPLEARAALDQHDAELVLQLLDRGRKRRLGDAAALGRPAEMLLLGERDEEFQLVDHGGKLPAIRRVTPACAGYPVRR